MPKSLGRNDKELIPFSIGNHISSWAYTLCRYQQKGTLPQNIRVRNENNTETSYQVILVLPLARYGMYAYLLLPHDPSDKVIVTFRGTQPMELQSLSLNFEYNGPTADSYSLAEESSFQFTLEKIKAYYNEHGIKNPQLTLQIFGHSQGGVLAQLFCATLLKKRAYFKSLDILKELHMTVFNSPGIPKYIIAAATTHFLAQHLKKPLKCIAHFGMVGGDPIQTFGNEMLFSQKKLLPFIIANLLKVDKGLEKIWLKNFGLGFFSWFPKGILEAHSSLRFLLNEQGELYSCKFYTNQNLNDISPMFAELSNKTPLQTLIVITPILNTIREFLILYFLGESFYHGTELVESVLDTLWKQVFKTPEYVRWTQKLLQTLFTWTQTKFKIDETGLLYPKTPLPVPNKWEWSTPNPISWWYGKKPIATVAAEETKKQIDVLNRFKRL